MTAVAKYIVAGFVRYWLIHIDYWQTIANRVEIATPLNSWKRLTEGVYLYDHNINPYEGDAFHESPIMLILFHWLMKKVPYLLPLLFTLLDLLTAHLLYRTSRAFARLFKDTQLKTRDDIHEESKTLLLSDDQLSEVPEYVLSVYLFNPYSVLNCVGMTTTVVQNVMVAASLWAATGGRRELACICVALATHQALYPVLLIVPVAILLADKNIGCVKCSYIRTLLIFVLCWGFLIYVSAFIMNGSYQYLNNTYGLM